ncbi:0aa683cf-bfad-4178-adc3-da506e285bea-CDS [Sclerotinia trifoliorum]|uniref:0aa683cf-bfad-4178-adc3-da506e285bea-CDS n=1 Tax=Sclerotinia trifoliorum TaxID=28548 RepID=A0A8H2VPM2_9HELO|nr:0aa683cf-bfad-4178-adc3-da506e285bea-CDS [Sclerotinia trifoliorum]
MHMIGRDATDEIRALHSKDTQVFMRKFVIGVVEGRWKIFLPSIRGCFRGWSGRMRMRMMGFCARREERKKKKKEEMLAC